MGTPARYGSWRRSGGGSARTWPAAGRQEPARARPGPDPYFPPTVRGRRASWSLHEALAKVEARADRLEAALGEARRPWLARLLEALRGKG